MMKRASIVGLLGIALILAGCPLSGSVTIRPVHPIDADLVGTWKLVSMTEDGELITCPGTSASGLSTCGENDTLTLMADGTFTETFSSIANGNKIWFAVDGVLIADNAAPAHNPKARAYELNGDRLTIRPMESCPGSTFESTFERVP